MKHEKTALYIHIPFCHTKCNYCDFISYTNRSADIERYLAATRKEIYLRAKGFEITSLYFGGGTPSLLSPQQIGTLIASVSQVANIATGAEVTLEANPGTVNLDYLEAIMDQGVNRLSIGAQSFNDTELELLGRRHKACQTRAIFLAAREAGFQNISLDLIYGLPHQDPDSFRKSLGAALELKPEHISLYSLSLEEGTLLKDSVDRGNLPAPDEDICAYQYVLGEEMLLSAGYHHYEISNWAIPGREGQHNLVYWRRLSYLGVGVAAHSLLGGKRSANTTDLDAYILAMEQNRPVPQTFIEDITACVALAETILLGLRLSYGVDLDAVSTAFGVNAPQYYSSEISELAYLGLIEQKGAHLRLTPRGRLLGNEVFWRFLPKYSNEVTSAPK